MSLTIAGALWAGWIAAGAIREHGHRRRLDEIPNRILVSGMRGKSSLVRLIHHGLRVAGHPTVGRVSGDSPLLLLAKGEEIPSPRRGNADVGEMRRLFRLDPFLGVQSVVLENMAVRPDLTEVVGRRMVHPTLQILAVDAPDHLDHYPVEPAMRAACILDTLDPAATVVITPSMANSELVTQARARGLALLEATAAPSPDLRPFMAALLGAATAAVGAVEVLTDDVRRAMHDEALRLQRLRCVVMPGGLHVLDLLSANDPASTLSLARLAQHDFGAGDHDCGLLYVHRADRAARLVSFIPLFAKFSSWITGDRAPTSITRRCGVVAVENPDWSTWADHRLLFLAGNATQAGEALRARLRAEGEARPW